MESTQALGKRSSLLIKNQIYSLVILPTSEKRKLNLLFLWLMAWSVSGVLVIANYFTLTNENEKTVLIVWLAFWAYFEFKIMRVYMWKRFGKEKLWIKNGTLFYQQDINGRGKIKEYDINLISEFRVLPIKESSFVDSFFQSYWVKGGERIEFNTQQKLQRFGLQLEDDEAKKIVASLHKFLKL